MSVGGIALHLRGEVKGIFFDWLRSQRPDLLPLYERRIPAAHTHRRRSGERLAALRRRPGRGQRALLPRGRGAPRRGGVRAGRAAQGEAPPEQPRLF